MKLEKEKKREFKIKRRRRGAKVTKLQPPLHLEKLVIVYGVWFVFSSMSKWLHPTLHITTNETSKFLSVQRTASTNTCSHLPSRQYDERSSQYLAESTFICSLLSCQWTWAVNGEVNKSYLFVLLHLQGLWILPYLVRLHAPPSLESLMLAK